MGSERNGIIKCTTKRFETSHGKIAAHTIAAIRTALEAANVEFTNGDAPGVRLISSKTNKG